MTILHGVVTKAGAMSKTVTVTVSRKVVHPILLKVSEAPGRGQRCASNELECSSSIVFLAGNDTA